MASHWIEIMFTFDLTLELLRVIVNINLAKAVRISWLSVACYLYS